MRKIISVVLILVFLFNVVGYYAVYMSMVHAGNRQAENAFENESFDQTETFTLKIPIALPYLVQNGFQRVSGDFEHDGEFYKLVGQKYENDTIYVVCLRNETQKKASELLSHCVRQSTGQSSSPGQNKSLSGLLKDFDPTFERIRVSPVLSVIAKLSFNRGDLRTVSPHYPVPTPPPDLIG